VRTPSRPSLTRLHGQAQTESGQDRGQRIEPRIASLGERPIQRLAGETGFLGECSHATNSIRNGTQCDGYGSLIAVGQHRFQVLCNLNLAF
jgi:hypothetical protein